jgi:hypothetical protein
MDSEVVRIVNRLHACLNQFVFISNSFGTLLTSWLQTIVPEGAAPRTIFLEVILSNTETSLCDILGNHATKFDCEQITRYVFVKFSTQLISFLSECSQHRTWSIS